MPQRCAACAQGGVAQRFAPRSDTPPSRTPRPLLTWQVDDASALLVGQYYVLNFKDVDGKFNNAM